MTSVDVSPTLTAELFPDEFGEIDRCVYETALALWPKAEREALKTFRDSATGRSLLMKACALVTRKRAASAETITNLAAYLYRTWQRLLLEELEKENLHRLIEENLFAETVAHSVHHAGDELDRRILLQQIVSRMDD